MFIETTFPSKFYLYQFGNGLEDFIVFPKSNLTCRVGHTVKLAEIENNFFDGKVRLNSDKRNKLGAATLEVNFAWPKDNYFDLHKVKVVFFSGLKPIFFYTYDKQSDRVRFFYNPFAEATEIVSQEQLSSSDLGVDFELVRVKLQLLFPFVYECTQNDYFRFYDYFDYSLTSEITSLYYGDANLVYGMSGRFYGQQASNPDLVTVEYYTLSNKQQKELFINREQGLVLVFKDGFFSPIPSYTNLFNFFSPLVNTNLTNNNNVFVDLLSTELQDTTAENKVYIVVLKELDENKVFDGIGQSVLIENVDNNSDLIIEWRSPLSSPKALMFLSYTQLLYDYSTGQPIPLDRYRIYQTKPDFLYFSALGRQNKIFAKQYETLRLKKDSPFNTKIELFALPTYVL